MRSIWHAGAIVPTIMYANFTAKYVRRMLTWSKLYEGTYGRTAIHGLITGVLLLGTILITLASIVARLSGISEAGTTASIGSTAILAGMVVTYVGYLMVRTPIKRMHASRGNDFQTTGPVRAVALLVLMPVTQVLYVYSLVSALFAKQVRWRDATYEINSKSDVRLLSYEPFLREEDSGSSII